MNPRPKQKWIEDPELKPVKGIKKLPKEKSLGTLKSELTKVFNSYIRQRDSQGGKFECISCGKFLPVKQMNAGHYHSAGHNESIRWDETNVNGQCVRCNCFLHGNLIEYRKGMIKKWGTKILEGLDIKRHNRSKMTKFEVSLLIQEYKYKLSK